MKQDPIRNCEEFEASLRNYSWLGDSVPGASDIDMVLHASNPGGDDRFLAFEFKMPGHILPRGQQILHEGLRRQGWTVVVVWGPDADDLFVLGGDWRGREKVTREELSAMVRAWWSAAKQRKVA